MMIRKALLLLAVFMNSLVCAAPPGQAATPVEILSAEFGIFDASKPGELAFEPTAVVPHRVGQRYGWVIEVRTTRRSLSVREEYLLPTTAKAATAGDPLAESLSITTQRRNQVSQRQLVPVDGRIIGEWEIGPHEPAGQRHLQVIIEGHLGGSFQYRVE
ncbi:MAG: hypothetical protein KKF85_09230 [Gammaproteobacteria bacterium]|nr:hypothetical protein [Rhodocyclaceae bacterium]MBU3908150.1 hypothetical protein [Gammaproteobacteria bacterium]MBU3989745.1 hypothetical protein [Gammaproteobacteria bacterium]MBU4005791.1 hypothetical protein [Gammaproteobacteria bacterium]MBU4021461.1 hypothetical protein [Gammaproteobacteria bacterium]